MENVPWLLPQTTSTNLQYQIYLNILCNKPNNEKSSWFHFKCNELKVILQEDKKATQVSSQSIIFPDLCTALPS